MISISFIIPSYNNLRHLKNVYASIKKHAPNAEVILLDDGSTDGTWEWICEEAEGQSYRSPERVGHTILYDKGISMATNDIVGILHADMIIGPNYVENLVKHLKPGKVVCATRIEPPLHPAGNEKIIQDFGQDFDTLNIPAFEEFCNHAQQEYENKTTRGMFAPWILYKKDMVAIGGHDDLFAPFPYEDSDIFQRWLLAGYELVQSRDALVYHLTCRGHRWNKEVGKDDDYFKTASQKAARNYLRKWGSWIRNDEYHHPIVLPKYNIAFVVGNCNLSLLGALEPWCDRIYVEEVFAIGRAWDYVEIEGANTKYDLSKRVLTSKANNPIAENDIVVEFDAAQLNGDNFHTLRQLPQIIAESGEVGQFELDIFKITINSLTRYEKDLIVNTTNKYL